MKIGILTFHCAHNYGAVLQAYALQQFLSSQGYDVSIIDYRPEYLLHPYRLFIDVKSIRTFVRSCITALPQLVRRNNFSSFINKELNLRTIDLNQKSDYDAIIYGSDQIWSAEIANGFDNIYFAEFKAAQNKINIVYAASTGSLNYNSEQAAYLYNSINTNFNSVSTRESNFSLLLSQIVKSTIPVVLDPTLLVDRSLFHKLGTEKHEQNYLLVYQVIADKRVRDIARNMAKKLNCTHIIELANGVQLDKNVRSCASPYEFIAYFLNAKYVLTTSFHGTAFSLIFEKAFMVVSLNDKLCARSKALLSQLGLETRLTDVDDFEICKSEIDYNVVNSKLLLLKEHSRNYLLNALK